MNQLIEKYFNDLQGKIHDNLNDIVGSLTFTGNGKKLVDNWDEIMAFLEAKSEELNEVFGSEDENMEPEVNDYIKLAALNILHALMCRLDENHPEEEE